MSDSPFFFLFGGRDLEMLTIRTLLEENGYVRGQDFLDKELAWGASWKDYLADIIELELDERTIQIVGIELGDKGSKPSGAIDIDHHNERSHEKSSLEQIADLLKITLSRKQRLIAANDCAYIQGMMDEGATKEEIEAIRLADRQAQGVTAEDEKLAEQSIAFAKWEVDVCTIQALTEKFSPITDKLYGQADKLLVFTDSKLTYYGFGVDRLASTFDAEIKDGKAYHGGGVNGFFGIAENAFTKAELSNIINRIIKIVSNEK